MSNNLGQIYATTREEQKYIIIDSQNVEVSGNLTLSNDVNINNGIISTNKQLLNYSNTSGSGTYDSVGIDYV